MAKSLVVIGVEKPKGVPPRWAPQALPGASPQAAPEAPPSGEESAGFEQKVHDLPAGGKFPAENVNYHTSADRCDGCHHWDLSGMCKVVSQATDPAGWCLLFPGEYEEHELSEKPGEEEVSEADGSEVA